MRRKGPTPAVFAKVDEWAFQPDRPNCTCLVVSDGLLRGRARLRGIRAGRRADDLGAACGSPGGVGALKFGRVVSAGSCRLELV